LDFISECSEVISSIEESSADGISPELLDKIHTLKGNSGTLGASKIFNQTQVCELLGRQNKSLEFIEEMKILKKHILEFQEFFKNETIFES
jgi:HPt (histidine-containing phosphotransfer) domain-containing protein